MKTPSFNLLLADDDLDDCAFFKDALEDLNLSAKLVTVNDGVQLMHFLKSNDNNLPDILFLDLNMPRKSGFECLAEIKRHETFKTIPVIIFSTSLDMEAVNLLYQKGSHYYIRKPGEYAKLKKVISEGLRLMVQNHFKQPPQAQFIIQA